MARIKKSLAALLVTREDAEAALGKLAELSYSRDMMVSKLDLELKVVRENYEFHISTVSKEIDAHFDALNVWSDGHPNEFASRKSIDMVHGTIGYRTCPPKLKLLRGWTWERVAAAVQQVIPKYMRFKIEVAKDALLDDRDAFTPEQMADIGVSVVNDETFFVTPKQEVI
jgi:phage host-nuclease inhibitor protein Gam